MATVKRSSLAMSGTAWSAWFNALNCPIITASGKVITIDDTYTITKDDYNITCKKGATTVFTMSCNNPMTVTVCCSETLVYIQASDPQSRRFLFVYEKLDDIILFGYYSSGNTTGVAFKSITDISYTDINTEIIYNHGARLNYADSLGYIDYAPEILFLGGNKSVDDPNFVACSTIQKDQVITFQGRNYYSVGANALVEINEEV